MVSSGLNMLTDVVNLSSGNIVTITTPKTLLEPELTIRPKSITEILCSKMDSVYFRILSEAALTYLRLAYYRNQLLHLFVKDAMLALCLTPESDYGIPLYVCQCGYLSE